MGLAFLVPAFLAGLAALLIPLVIHLRQREWERPRRFPSLMFLRRIPIRTARRRRVTDWLLLLLRAGVFTLLVAAFARPFIRKTAVTAATAPARAVVLLLDRSMSMGHREVWPAALDSARRLIGALRSQDRGALVLFDEEAEVAQPLTADHGAVLAALAAAQTRTWASSERLWTHALATAPSSVAYYNLGVLSERQGRWDEAIDYYRQALRLKPAYPEAHYNWGVILARQQRPTEAIEHYREALRIKPDHAEAHYNWGLLASAEGRDDEAIEHYRLALEAKPKLAAAHNNWGNALVRQGRWSSAVDHYREALRLKPDYAEAHNNIASAFARQERWDDAISHYRKALEIRPDFGPARENLERLLSRPESRALWRSGS